MNKNENTVHRGTLTVSVTSAEGALPIENATVTITGADAANSDFTVTKYTSRDGVTPTISLPAPSYEFSQSPETPYAGFSSFDVDVYAANYYRKKIYSVSVFPGVNSTLPVSLVPYSRYVPENNMPQDSGSIDIEGGISEGEK